jgi:anti-sigma-K factor RskA
VVTCAKCRAELDELSALPGLLEQAAEPFEAPEGLRARTMAAVEREAVPQDVVRRAWWMRAAAGASVAAAVVVALILGIQIGRQSQGPRIVSPAAQGALEMQEVLRSPSDRSRTAHAEVRHGPHGRMVSFRTEELPTLPEDRHYELWFVGPGDARGRPRRVSAGTFTPDEHGRASVLLVVAVDPAEYTIITVSVEPLNGNPAREGPDVMRSDVYPQ